MRAYNIIKYMYIHKLTFYPNSGRLLQKPLFKSASFSSVFFFSNTTDFINGIEFFDTEIGLCLTFRLLV